MEYDRGFQQTQSVFRTEMTTPALAYRLLKRVSPLSTETLRGYLMRAAEANGRSSADRVVVEALGYVSLTITPAQALQLADYCRCAPSEFFQLSGIEYRNTDGSRFWKVEGNAVTKDYLIRASRQALCPKCLESHPVLKARWDLTLYTACVTHRCLLLEKCPKCARLISPRRTKLAVCNCGFSFSEAPVVEAAECLLVVSSLIDHAIAGDRERSFCSFSYLESPMLERLAAMALETLLKSLWFFGLLVAESRMPGIGRGRRRRGVDAAGTIVREAISLLRDWPTGFLTALERIREASSINFALNEASHLAQVRGYLDGEMRLLPESTFVAAAYDRFISNWWAATGKAPRSNMAPSQMELF